MVKGKRETESTREAKLTPTGRVILGMIGLGKTTGYEIKQLVDRSTRNFWAASYGQIYPELQRLESEGLLRGRPEPAGGRARTVYELTDAGRAALEAWLNSDEALVGELRDEGMLKLFFSDLVDPERQLAIVAQMRATAERKLERLSAIDHSIDDPPSGPQLTLEYGLGLTRWMLEACAQTERRLAARLGHGADAGEVA
jgi:DNA-binding PadR family transcriptional regulator